MRPPLLILALVMAATLSHAQQHATQAPADDTATTVITVRSSLVVVPALVRTKDGRLVYTLKADDFILTDDGVPQTLRLDEDTGDQPLALVVVVETGSDGAAHLSDYQNLSPVLDALVGQVEHKIALVGFDSHPTLLHGFTDNTDFIQHSLDILDPGDKQNATLDAIVFATNLLRKQPPRYRRAVLLLSETIDHGSHTRFVDALRAISDTNTAMYSVGFNSTKAELGNEAARLNDPTPGPEHGCFSRDFGVDDEGNPIPPPTSAADQTYNCFAELLPPLRIAKIAEIIARNMLRRNVSSSVARLTGGEHFKYHDAKTLQRDLIALSNHIPNRYTLTFRPQNPHPGFHALEVKLKNYDNLKIEARNGYWAEEEPVVSGK